jgi:hypothetical protein
MEIKLNDELEVLIRKIVRKELRNEKPRTIDGITNYLHNNEYYIIKNCVVLLDFAPDSYFRVNVRNYDEIPYNMDFTNSYQYKISYKECSRRIIFQPSQNNKKVIISYRSIEG